MFKEEGKRKIGKREKAQKGGGNRWEQDRRVQKSRKEERGGEREEKGRWNGREEGR